MRPLIFLAAFWSTTFIASAQKNSTGNWFIYFGNQPISKKWNLSNEVQIRNYNFAGDLQQLLLRAGIGRDIAKDLNLLLGYGFIYSENYSAGSDEKTSSREHRIYQQLISKQKWGRALITHRYRFEQRFIEEHFRLRLRYFLSANIPVTAPELRKNTLYLSLYNEVFLNTDQTIFDRNRVYGAVGFIPAQGLKLEAGLMRQSVAGSGRNQFQIAFFNNRAF